MSVRAALVFVAVLAAQAQEPKDPFRTLADAAMAAPPELAADVLIRLAESGKVSDKESRTEWLERAFHLAGSAKFAQPRSVGRSITTDSDAGDMHAALQSGLDTLSLQSRVIRAILPLDRTKAMDLFQSVPPLQIPALSCKDAIAYSAAPYYDMVRAVYEHGFSAEERKDEKHLDLLRNVVGRMASPSELAPAANLIKQLHLEAELLGRYAGALRQMQADDRSFDFAGNLTVFQNYAFMQALRVYLVRHLSGKRCADNTDNRQLNVFNTAMRAFEYDKGDLAPITDEESKPAKTEGRMELFSYWGTPRTKKLLMDLKQLRFGTENQQAENNKKPRRADGRTQFLTEEQRSDPAWEASVREFLHDVERWSKDHEEAEANYFHMGAQIYAVLIELIPARDLRGEILRSYISFLRQSPLARDNPPAWFLQVKRLINFGGDVEPERTWIHGEIKASGDLVMNLYVDLEALRSGGNAPR
jgi:hypothetical protein